MCSALNSYSGPGTFIFMFIDQPNDPVVDWHPGARSAFQSATATRLTSDPTKSNPDQNENAIIHHIVVALRESSVLDNL